MAYTKEEVEWMKEQMKLRGSYKAKPDDDDSGVGGAGGSPSKKIITLDDIAAENGAFKTQNQWIKYFNKRGEIMISASDLYQALKDGSIPKKTLASLRDDFEGDRWLVTSTRLMYQPTSLDGKVIQHYGTNPKIIKPSEQKVLIPYLSGELITSAKSQPEILSYLQAYLGTKDGADEIIANIEKLGYKRKETKLWTPDLDSRSRLVERAAVLDYDDSGFRLLGNGNPDDDVGRSRRVQINPPAGGV